MYGFFAEYVSFQKTILSILDSEGNTIASRDVQIGKETFVQSLTSDMVDLSHEQDLYHNDIFAIGVVVNPTKSLGWEAEQQFLKEIEKFFCFFSIVFVYSFIVFERILCVYDYG